MVNVRAPIASIVNIRHTAEVATSRLSCDGDLSRLGITPGGGSSAGVRSMLTSLKLAMTLCKWGTIKLDSSRVG